MGVFHGFDFKLEPIAPLEASPPETWTLRGEAWLFDQPGVGCYKVSGIGRRDSIVTKTREDELKRRSRTRQPPPRSGLVQR